MGFNQALVQQGHEGEKRERRCGAEAALCSGTLRLLCIQLGQVPPGMRPLECWLGPGDSSEPASQSSGLGKEPELRSRCAFCLPV